MTPQQKRRQMSKARAAWKQLCKERRHQKRVDEKAERAKQRVIEKLVTQQRKAELREAARRHQKMVDMQNKRPRGRPPKPPPRPARWTRYSPEHPREIYRAIKVGRCFSDDASVGDFFGVCAPTVNNWRERHPAFTRAIMRGYEDRAAIRGAIQSCARVEFDFTRINPDAKTDRGRFSRVIKAARPSFDFDRHAHLAEDGHLKHQLRRRWRDGPPPSKHAPGGPSDAPYAALAVAAVEDGARSNRAVAARLCVAESTIRLWREKYPEFDAAIRDALDRYPQPATSLASKAGCGLP